MPCRCTSTGQLTLLALKELLVDLQGVLVAVVADFERDKEEKCKCQKDEVLAPPKAVAKMRLGLSSLPA